MPCFGLHPQGFTVSSIPALMHQRVIRAHEKRGCIALFGGARSHHRWGQAVSFLCHCRDSRHPHLRGGCVLSWWGDFPQQHHVPPSAALSLSLFNRAAPYLHLMDALTSEEGTLAVRLARSVLEHAIGGMPEAAIPLPPVFREKRGVFVTLTKKGELRGCIGFPQPHLPLQQAVREAAYAAAREDPRFPPVQARELPGIRVEVTVLSVPMLLTVAPKDRTEAVIVGRHGLIVRGYGRSGLLLPQVPVEWNWDAREFLDHTCMKAGLPAGCWKERGVEVYTFEGQIYSETPPDTGRNTG